ncbi:MAG: aspartate kinase [Chloroflexota bacterium]
MIVMKFGGTSVGNATMIHQAVTLVRQTVQAGESVVVVVSAMNGVTDVLFKAATVAARRDLDLCWRIHQAIQARHGRAARALLPDGPGRRTLQRGLAALLRDFRRLCESIAILGECTPRGLDAVSSLGERLMVRLFAAALEVGGVPARPVEASAFLVTDDRYGEATPLLEETRTRSRALLGPLLAERITPVVTGFIGTTGDGVITTLGRGGSDYSAAILGSCLACREIWICTDVDGVLTADPRLVPEADTIPELSYAEAAELSYFGAKVLHPKTILPALEAGIPVRVVNASCPEGPGTLIVAQERPTPGTVKGITAIRGLSLVTVEGRGMVGVPGIAARVFAAVARERISVLMISQGSSEQSICFVIPQSVAERAQIALEAEFEQELARRAIDRVTIQSPVAIVAVVGAGMRRTPGIAARVFGALGANGINVICIAQGSSECNVSLVVDEPEMPAAVRHIHRAFGLGRTASEERRVERTPAARG